MYLNVECICDPASENPTLILVIYNFLHQIIQNNVKNILWKHCRIENHVEYLNHIENGAYIFSYSFHRQAHIFNIFLNKSTIK